LNENKAAKNIFKTIGNAFQAIYMPIKIHKQFENNPNAYQPNNPLYGVLKYRNRHILKLDVDAYYKRFGLGTNISYYSFIDNVDAVFKTLIPGVSKAREEKNFQGDFIVNLRASYKVKDKVSFIFIVRNLLNNNYALRPAKQNAPINYTFKTSFYF